VGSHGHHLCGPEFDPYLDAASRWVRLIPLAHIVSASLLVVVGFRNVRRAARAAKG
jgi:hypothetical protein